MGKKRRVEEIDGVLHFECSSCREMKTEECFTFNKKSPIKLNYYCRECMSKEKKTQNHNIKLSDSKYPRYVETVTDILESLGYNMEKDISEQFINRIKDRYNIDLS
jgi:hypothetical protein